jgi:hypothetical protein
MSNEKQQNTVAPLYEPAQSPFLNDWETHLQSEDDSEDVDRKYCPILNPRFLCRDPVFRSILSYFLRPTALRYIQGAPKHYAINDSEAHENLVDEIEHVHELPIVYSGSFNSDIPPSAPTNSARLDRAFLCAQLKANFQSTTSIMWPLALTGATTIHDLIHYYRYPEDRYNYSLVPTLLGFAPIEASWNYHFGADLVNDPHYLLAFMLLLPFPIMLAITLLRHYAPSTPLTALLTDRALRDKIRQGEHKHYLPWNAYTHTIEKNTFKVLWDSKQSAEDKDKVLKTLLEITKQPLRSSSYQAILALADIANKTPTASDTVAQDALRYLIQIADGDPNPFKKLLATHQRWTLHRLPQSYYEPLFWLLSTLGYFSVLLANFHAIRLISFKIKGLSDYYGDKDACEADEKIFRCLNQIEACICALCADWAEAATADHTPSVYYAQSDNPQACLNALLSEKRTPEYILATLPRFLGRTNITEFDASRQEGPTWTASEWDALLTLLENHHATLKIFNLSSSDGTPLSFSGSQLTRLRDFLHSVRIDQLDLAGQNLGAIGLSLMMEGLSNVSWRALDISRNQLKDRGISVLAELLPEAPALTSLKLSGNGMTDDGAYLLFDALQQGIQVLDTLTHLDVSDNLAGKSGLTQLLAVFYNRSLTSLALSRLPLTPPVFAALSPLLPQLKQLSAVDADISDTELWALSPSNATVECNDTEIRTAHYDFSHNLFGDAGAEKLLAALPNRQPCVRTENSTQPPFANPAITLSLGYTQISDALLPKIALFLREKYIVGLKLDGLLITAPELLRVLPDFCHPDTFLSELGLTDMPLSDPIASQLAYLLKTSTCAERLLALDIAHTDLTGSGAVELFAALPKTHLQKLSLANNPLTGSALTWTNQTQNTLPLTMLDLSNSALDQNDVDQLLILMSQTPHLTEFTLSHNYLGPGAGAQFAQMLLTPIPPHANQLTNPHIPRDLKRLLGFQTPLAKMHLEPATQLQALYLSDTGIDTPDARALCRVSNRAGFFAPALNLENNPAINARFVNPRTCEISGAHTNAISASAVVLLSLCWLLPCLLRATHTTPAKKHTHARDTEEADTPVVANGFFSARTTCRTEHSTTHPASSNNYGIVSYFGSATIALIFALIAYSQDHSYEHQGLSFP